MLFSFHPLHFEKVYKEAHMAKTIIFSILIALVLVFVIQNTLVVEYRFLAWTVSMPRALLLFGTLVIGVLVGWLSRRLKQRGGKEA